MKSPIAVMVLAGSLTALTAHAQGILPAAPRPADTPTPRTAPAAPGATNDPEVLPATATLPAPVPPDQIQPPTIALPNDPIEPYLLTKDVGPFMVVAKTFRGPEAERFALALVLELRNEYGLPAFILRTKDYPRNTLIRNLPPTAPAGLDRPRLGDPERVRTIDEAAVLVGNEKSIRAQEILYHKVRKIKPKCLDGLPKLFIWREGLGKAMRTTNPYVPAQNLFPGKGDALVFRMNQGPRSIGNCPGRFSLQIAQFSGRSTFNVDGAHSLGEQSLRRSPLVTAADDAEHLAESLSKTPEIKQLGQPVYVYHDRTSSRVMIGSFNSPTDPKAAEVHNAMLRLAVPLMDTVDRKRGIDKMIVPATALTDLDPFKVNLR